MTRRQSSNQWSGGIVAHPTPKNSKCKNPWKSSRCDFLESRRHPPHLLSSKGPNYQCGLLLISAGAVEGYFEGKTSWEVHRGVLILARQCPGSPGTCNPEGTGLPVSYHPPYSSDQAPSDYHLFPGLKKQLESLHFRLTRKSLLPRRPGWMDNVLNFF